MGGHGLLDKLREAKHPDKLSISSLVKIGAPNISALIESQLRK